jgi:dienelactone hydrolase
MQLPAPRGQLGVGRTTFVFVDSNRADPWVPSERRVVRVVTWYPTDAPRGSSHAAYLPNAGALPGPFGRGERWAVARLSSHAIEDASVSASAATYPALLFSPGNDMASEYYSALIEELASAGYIVIGLDHAHEGKGQILPSGARLESEVDKHRPPTPGAAVDFYRTRVRWRADDASFVMSKLTSIGAPSVFARIDTTRVGALGHSIGGVAAAEACRRNRRIRACANLDGLLNSKPIIPDNGSFALAQPFLFLGKPLPFTNPAVNESATRELDAAIASGGGGYHVTLDETHHDTFSDIPFMTPTFRPTRNRANLEVIRSAILAFFDKTLRGRPAPTLDDSTTLSAGRVRVTRLRAASDR